MRKTRWLLAGAVGACVISASVVGWHVTQQPTLAPSIVSAPSDRLSVAGRPEFWCESRFPRLFVGAQSSQSLYSQLAALQQRVGESD